MKKIRVNFKEAYNSLVHNTRKNIEEAIEEKVEDLPPRSGLFLTDDDEKMPIYGPVAGCERIISRKKTTIGSAGNKLASFHSGARIVLTKDNYGSRATGLGGAGGTKCEAIDIVAGQLSSEEVISDNVTKSRANFATDGARIYLTERGNVNHYFGTENSDPLTSVSSNLKSGIGIKSDHTLIIGRERVRILAGLGKFDGGERLSNGNKDVRSIIELGSIVEDDYQAAVRGENLIKYLGELNGYINAMASKINTLEKNLSIYKVALGRHIHVVVGAGPSTPSPSAALKAGQGVTEFLNQNLEGAVEEFHKVKTNVQFLGIEGGKLKGVKEDYILSNTVFIGR